MSVSLAVLLDRPSLSLSYDTISSSCGDSQLEDGEAHQPHTLEIGATIVVKVSKPTRVSALRASFISQQFLHDREESRSGSVELFSQTITLVGGSVDVKGASQLVLAPGLHQYKVDFVVPSWLPPTFNSSSNRVTHRIVAHFSQAGAAYFPFSLKRYTKTAVQELVVLREAPTSVNALRYWSGERRSAATSLAIKTTRFARINGRIRISMRVKSLEQIHSCKVDIVQDESGRTEVQDDSPWHALPASTSGSTHLQRSQMMMMMMPPLGFGAGGVKACEYTKRKFPMPTISTAFPDPAEDPADTTPADTTGDGAGAGATTRAVPTATLSTLSLGFPVAGPGLHARYESPMLSISHKLRIRVRFHNPAVKEIVVNIPITLFEGSASCDDIPPYYEEIYAEAGEERRSRADSVATLPLYTANEAGSSTAAAASAPSVAVGETGSGRIGGTGREVTVPTASRCASACSDRTQESSSAWLDGDRHMSPVAIAT